LKGSRRLLGVHTKKGGGCVRPLVFSENPQRPRPSLDEERRKIARRNCTTTVKAEK